MKFNANAIIEILDSEVLEIVNDQQEWDNLEPFDTLEEVPMELVLVALDAVDYFEEEISDYIYPIDFTITLIP
jgi:hypothetical protein